MIHRLQEACWCHWRHPRPYSNSQFWLNCCNVRHKNKTSSSINYVLMFSRILTSFCSLVLSSYSIQHSIFLTRQFTVDNGNLVDKSTGKRVKTDSANLIGVTLSDPSVSFERDLLTDATCFATTTMMHETYLEYLTGTETRYIVKIENVTWPGIVIDGLVTYEPFEDDQGVACNLYRNVMVVSQPDVVYQVECCGTEEGNCCVNADQAQGQRRLKACVESC